MSKIEIAEESMTRKKDKNQKLAGIRNIFLKENRKKIDVSPGFIWLVNIC